ncbi:MAG: NAD(P) transhydrogenase [Planctomycetota bacterium]|jgi:NAD(P) transhydrogenase
MKPCNQFDLIVIGSGPAGQKAAIQGSKAGRKILIVERERDPGGECVQHGTIPSKTLRETAASLTGLRKRTGGCLDLELGTDTKLRALMGRVEEVLEAHCTFIGEQLERNDVVLLRGRASFLDKNTVQVRSLGGVDNCYTAKTIVIAAGSRPRNPKGLGVDHEHIFDSDSILSLAYLPASLLVIGAGVIACEFATVFQALGVSVTIIDKGERPMPFLDPELSERLVSDFSDAGGVYLPGVEPESIEVLEGGGTRTRLSDGQELLCDKAFVALGRTASLAGLGLEELGVELTNRGHIKVDKNLQTTVPNIYAVGDIIGPPALAATAMEQGRRAVQHALGLEIGVGHQFMPVGIYTIPEIAGVGISSAEADVKTIVGRANFSEVARGHIIGATVGVLKLVADAEGRYILGAHVIGEGATELVHLGQIAMLGRLDVDTLIDNIFNFPTMAEAYRIAAFDIVQQRNALRSRDAA